MLKYLIILLDDSAVSYCHYESGNERRLISAESLKDAILFAMKENLNVQIVWPDYDIPESHKEIISMTDHVNFADVVFAPDADVVVADKKSLSLIPDDAVAVVKLTLADFIHEPQMLFPALRRVRRLNVVVDGVENFSDDMIESYSSTLEKLSEVVAEEYGKGHYVQFNMLTDRMMLDKMNNCNAGWESLTVAPDGNFYVCPAFYYAGGESSGNPKSGVEIKNPQLYRLDHAPICRICDAYQCRRCVWLNKELTLEVNTPGRQQCVMAHIERNMSRKLLSDLRKLGNFMPDNEIKKLDYLDPFEIIIKQ